MYVGVKLCIENVTNFYEIFFKKSREIILEKIDFNSMLLSFRYFFEVTRFIKFFIFSLKGVLICS